jgi:Spy/CpxP family protein refolding chaperone
MRSIVIGALIVAMAAGAAATSEQRSPYAGFERRDIKALSQEEIAGLLGGEGMGFSLVAELNGFPGPRHVLDLADRLGLDPVQRTRASAIEAEMKTAAIRIGRDVVALEAELDRLFREGMAEASAIQRLSGQIGDKRSALRAVHLEAHLAMAQVLKPEQQMQYMTLRGYGMDSPAPVHDPAAQKHRH